MKIIKFLLSDEGFAFMMLCFGIEMMILMTLMLLEDVGVL